MHPTELRAVPEHIVKSKKLSILMPFLNEEDIIVENTRTVMSMMRELKINYEIVLIDDGSTDGSFELLHRAFAKEKHVKLVRNHQNFGKGWVIKTGYEYSSGDYILFLDSDLELSPYHIPNFLRIMDEEKADAVIGSKLHKDSILDYPKARRVFSKTYYFMIRILFGLPIMDSQTGIKLFKREVLELSLPRLVIKQFAFDLELLVILHENKKKIVSAPIELKFSRGAFGKIRWKNIVQIMVDTLSIYFRDKILGFYKRELGENIRYHYTIILFQDTGDEYEKFSLERFLDISYEGYDVIVVGMTDFGIKHPRLKFIRSDSDSYTDRLTEVREKVKLKTDYIVLSALNAYPDARFFLSAGRILSLKGVGAAGGYVVLRTDAKPYEGLVQSVSKSIFLNANLHYRYRALNPKKVSELQLNGMIIKAEYIQSLNPENGRGMKLEVLLAREIDKNKESLIYSPDLLLYQRFPESYWEFVEGLQTQVNARLEQMFSGKKVRTLRDYKFFISVGVLFFVAGSLAAVFIFRKPEFMLPLYAYYGMLLLSRMLFFGMINGFRSFLLLAWAQLFYGFSLLKGLLTRALGAKIKKFLQRFS
jgi:glycosyltransferase involved in cell wall biosynthesis